MLHSVITYASQDTRKEGWKRPLSSNLSSSPQTAGAAVDSVKRFSHAGESVRVIGKHL